MVRGTIVRMDAVARRHIASRTWLAFSVGAIAVAATTGCATTGRATTDPSRSELKAQPTSKPGRSHNATPAVDEAPGSPDPSESAPPPLPKGTLVLHIGSSSAGALGVSLKAEFEKRGIKHVLHHKAATFIPQWTRRRMGLEALLGIYDPDLVLINLGGNEATLEDPTIRADAIERLVAKIGGRPCVWIGTPRWKALPHTGILQVIREHSAPCMFIDSDSLAPNLKPLEDGVHPTAAGRRRWARRVMAWLQHNRDPNGEQPWSFRTPVELPPED